MGAIENLLAVVGFKKIFFFNRAVLNAVADRMYLISKGREFQTEGAAWEKRVVTHVGMKGGVGRLHLLNDVIPD